VRHDRGVRVAVVAQPAGGGAWQPLADDGTPSGTPSVVDDLAVAVRDLEARSGPRWVLPSAAAYAHLVRRGVRMSRSHDVTLTRALLDSGTAGWHPPASTVEAPSGPSVMPGQQSLFDATGAAAPAGPREELAATVAEHAEQLRRTATLAATRTGFPLLVAAESAAGLAAVEMGAAGLPWDGDVHDEVLTRALGPRPPPGARPAVLDALAAEVAAGLDDPRLNPDSQADVLRSLRRAGLPVTSTRRHELRALLARHPHPALEPLLAYRELARLHAAHGWAWREQWVTGGRFHPEYVPGGVVSGRWATRGGGALQIPRAVRAAVVAPPGRVLVVADAGQLEPRVLAALSGDPGMIEATREGDLYTALARQALGTRGGDGARGGDDPRAQMKLALLSAMYGGGAGSPALVALRRRFPGALALLEDAAGTGEAGGSVVSVLGRMSPPARDGWLDGLSEEAAAGRRRAYGRFTRNFVVQASAADWAGVLLAGLRTRLATLAPDLEPAPGGPLARLVFFQHDEVVVECSAGLADEVVEAVGTAGTEATRLVLGDHGVHVPLAAVAVRSYAEKP